MILWGVFLSFYMLKQGDTEFSQRAIETNQPIYVFIYMYIYICIYVCNDRRNILRTLWRRDLITRTRDNSYVNKGVSVLFDSPPFTAGFRAIKGQLTYNIVTHTPFMQQRRSCGPNFFPLSFSLFFSSWVPPPTSAPTAVSLSFYIRHIKWYSNTGRQRMRRLVESPTFTWEQMCIYIRSKIKKEKIYILIYIQPTRCIKV